MASPLINPKFRAFTAAGAPLNGGKLESYIAGTSTPQATYTDYTLGVANTNPVILSSAGEADVWLGASAYKFILKDSANVVQWTEDNVSQANVGTGITNFAVNADSTTIAVASNTTTIVPANIAAVGDTYSEWTTATARFTPVSAGNYAIQFGAQILQNGANVTISSQFIAWLYKNGAQTRYAGLLSWPFATGTGTNVVPMVGATIPIALVVSDYIDIRFVTPVYTTATVNLQAAGVSIRRIN